MPSKWNKKNRQETPEQIRTREQEALFKAYPECVIISVASGIFKKNIPRERIPKTVEELQAVQNDFQGALNKVLDRAWPGVDSGEGLSYKLQTIMIQIKRVAGRLDQTVERLQGHRLISEAINHFKSDAEQWGLSKHDMEGYLWKLTTQLLVTALSGVDIFPLRSITKEWVRHTITPMQLDLLKALQTTLNPLQLKELHKELPFVGWVSQKGHDQYTIDVELEHACARIFTDSFELGLSVQDLWGVEVHSKDKQPLTPYDYTLKRINELQNGPIKERLMSQWEREFLLPNPSAAMREDVEVESTLQKNLDLVASTKKRNAL